MPAHVLIIDDDAGIAMALTARLQSAGYRVSRAASGTEGLEQAESLRPDLILLDVRMPDMNGLEVQEHLSGTAALAVIPVIFLSAHAEESIRQRAFSRGAKAFLRKPYEPSDLLSRVEAVLSESHSQPGIGVIIHEESPYC